MWSDKQFSTRVGGADGGLYYPQWCRTFKNYRGRQALDVNRREFQQCSTLDRPPGGSVFVFVCGHRGVFWGFFLSSLICFKLSQTAGGAASSR